MLEIEKIVRDFDNHIETGFQLATFQGPLCAEPVEGMAFFVEQVKVEKDLLAKEISTLGSSYRTSWLPLTSLIPAQNRMSQVTGSLISAVKDACRNGLLDWSPRLMLAMYSCEIQASGALFIVSSLLCELR